MIRKIKRKEKTNAHTFSEGIKSQETIPKHQLEDDDEKEPERVAKLFNLHLTFPRFLSQNEKQFTVHRNVHTHCAHSL